MQYERTDCQIRGKELQSERMDCLILGNELQSKRTDCLIRGNRIAIQENGLSNLRERITNL